MGRGLLTPALAFNPIERPVYRNSGRSGQDGSLGIWTGLIIPPSLHYVNSS